MKRTKYAVVTNTQFVSGPGGRISWTTNKREAKKWAKIVDGFVVDAEDYAKNWHLYKNGKREVAPSGK